MRLSACPRWSFIYQTPLHFIFQAASRKGWPPHEHHSIEFHSEVAPCIYKTNYIVLVFCSGSDVYSLKHYSFRSPLCILTQIYGLSRQICHLYDQRRTIASPGPDVHSVPLCRFLAFVALPRPEWLIPVTTASSTITPTLGS